MTKLVIIRQGQYDPNSQISVTITLSNEVIWQYIYVKDKNGNSIDGSQNRTIQLGSWADLLNKDNNTTFEVQNGPTTAQNYYAEMEWWIKEGGKETQRMTVGLHDDSSGVNNIDDNWDVGGKIEINERKRFDVTIRFRN